MRNPLKQKPWISFYFQVLVYCYTAALIVTAVRHVFDDPTLRVWHFCKPNDKMMVCQLYDSNSPNATLIGVEYMITADVYKNILDRDKPNWHSHKEEFAPNRADLIRFASNVDWQRNIFLAINHLHACIN
jgi:hypothetical protein